MSAWINQIFHAGQVNEGNIVRRSMHSVAKYASVDELQQEVQDRGFHMARIGEQFVIVCNPEGQIQIIC